MHTHRALYLASFFALSPACKRNAPTPTPAPSPSTPTASPAAATPDSGHALARPGAPSALMQPAQTLAPIAPATPTLTPTAAGSLSIGAGAGTTYRSYSGAWILRTNVFVRNTGTEPVDVSLDQFHNGENPRASDESTFPDHTSLIPNMTIQGDIAYYISPTDPKPTTLPLTFVVGEAPPAWHADVSLIFSPAPPAHGYAPTALVYALGVGVTQPATTWLQPEVGRIVQFTVTVNNTTAVPIVIPRTYLVPTVGSDNGSIWNEGSSLPDTLPIPVAGHVQGTIAFVFGAGTPVPTSVPVTFGPPNNPQFNQTVPVVEVPAPVPPT